MNISYRSVWSHATGAWVAVSEIARGRGKQGRAGRSARAAAGALAAALVLGGGAAMADTLVTQGTLEVASSGDVTGTVTVDNTDNANATLVIHENVSLDNAVNLNNGGTLKNSGSLVRTGPDDFAVESSGGATVDNTASGRIEGTDTGVRLSGGGTVTNAGTLQGQFAGLDIGGMGTVTNSGKITATGLTDGDGFVTGYGVRVTDGSGAVVNQLDGVITGVSHGVSIEGGTVTNHGKIEATGVDGQGVIAGGAPVAVINTGTIQALSSGARGVFIWSDDGDALTVTNAAGGKIISVDAGVQVNGTGTVTNSGQISATAPDGAGVYFGTVAGTLVNHLGGTIAGTAAGAVFDDGGTVTNSGTIESTGTDGRAVQTQGGDASVTNEATGILRGQLAGVEINGAGTVTNSGKITATGVDDNGDVTGYGVLIAGAPGTVVNQLGGVITGVSHGVLIDGGTVTNSGTITATGVTDQDGHVTGDGVLIAGAPGTVTNQLGGVITGVSRGVSANGGTVTNHGKIVATGLDGQGVMVGGAASTVTNTGTIQALGRGGRGVFIWSDDGDVITVTNAAGGQIMAENTGVQMNGTGTVTNSGKISATGTDGLGVYFGTAKGTLINQAGGTITGTSTGALLEFGGTVTNTGAGSAISASGAGSKGVFIDGGAGTVTNTAGSISGSLNGVLFWGGGSVTNTGGTLSASAGTSGQGVEMIGGVGTVTNQDGGVITGKLYGVSLADGGSVSNTASTIRADGTNQSTAGVGISGGTGTVTNTGAASLIQGTRYGVRLLDGGTVTNTGGTLKSTHTSGNGVVVEGGAGTITNEGGGLIEGGTGSLSYGVRATNGGTVFNTGSTIRGGTAGVYLLGGGKVTNTGGTISASASGSVGVSMSGAGGVAKEVINTGGGLIQGEAVGVVLNNGGTVTNELNSEIKGRNQSVNTVSGNTTLINKGKLTGDVNLNFQGAAQTHQVTLFSGASITGRLLIGNNANSTLRLDGEGTQRYSDAVTVSTTFAGSLIKQGSGTWTLDRAGTQASTALNTGRLDVTLGSALGAGKLTMAGDTTLGLAAGNLVLANAVDLNAGAGAAPVVDTGAFSGTLQGTIAGSGGFTKQGSGTLTLTGANTYQGPTRVEAGKLVLNGSLTSPGLLSVASGASLAGRGSVTGAVTVAGTLDLVQGQTFTTGALTLDAGSTINARLGAPSTTALAQVNGNLALNGSVNVTDGGGLDVGIYRLIGYTGLLSGSGLTLGSTPEGSGFSVQTAVAQQVNLVNTAGQTLNFWDGGDASKYNNSVIDGGTGTWTATGSTWTGLNGALNAPMSPQPGFAVFQGSAGTVTVDRGAGDVAVTGMQFASDAYVLKGAAVDLAGAEATVRVGDGDSPAMTASIEAVLAGAAKLKKTGEGTLVLTGANTYSGGTLVSAGTLQGNTTSLHGNIENNAALVFAQTADGSFDGQLSGSGTLAKTGAGKLTLTGDAAHTGGTTISAGTLQLGAGGSTGSLSGNVLNNGSLVINRSTALTLAGNISGSGGLRQSGSGVTTLSGANTYAGGTNINAGTLVVASNTALGIGNVSVNNAGDALANGKATLQIEAGVSVDNNIAIDQQNTLNNAGNITRTGVGQFGVGALAGASINNLATGKITGAQIGVVVLNGGTVTNAGLIDGGAASGVEANGGAATVINTRGGAITAATAGVILANGGTVINTGGSITATTAGYTGVYILGGAGVVTNTDGGRITGLGNGVWVNSANATVTNGVGSTIEGRSSSVYVPNGSVVLSNAGTMTGTVALGTKVPNAKHEVTLFSGSRIAGRLEMGTGTTSTLTLDGADAQLYSQAVRDTTVFAGTVTKQGSGTWTLDQTQNGLTTGNAQVAAGTLNVATRLNSAQVDVLSGATLTGGGTLAGAVNVADGGHLALRAGSTLTAASLVLNGSSQLDVALGAPSATGLLRLGGDLTLDGQLNVSDAGGFGRGAYRLIDYGGSLIDNGLTVGNVPLGYLSGDMAVQTGVAQQVNLVVGASSGTLRFWNGGVTQADGTVHGGDGTWSSAGSNWTTTDGSASQAWAHDYGVFQGIGGTVTVNGTQTFSGLQFADGYKVVNGSNAKLTAVNDTDGTAAIRVDRDATASIAVSIDGGATLDKRDRGTLVLSGANSYTGGTRVSGGTLAAAHNSALGSGVVTVDNTGDFGATLAVNAGVRISNEVILNNQGTLNNAGTIERPALESVGVTSQTGGATVNNLQGGLISGGTQGVQLHGGGTVNNAGGAIRSLLEGAGIETGGAAGTVNNTLGGTISGRYAGVSMYAGGTVNNTASTISADMPTASGVYVEGANAVVNNTGAGRIQGGGTGVNINSTAATVNNDVGSVIQGTGASLNAFQGDITLNNAGKMIGQVRLQGTGTHKVTLFTGSLIDGRLAMGTNTASTLTLDGTGSQTYSAAVTGATLFEGTLIKQGSGTWTLDQASTRSGATSLKAGRLNLGDDQALGTGELAMDDGTTLGFARDGLTIANAIHMTGNNDPVIDTGAFSQTLAGVISGGGFLTKDGSGTLTLTAANTYTGATNVAQGTLKAGGANTFSATSAHSVAAGATLDTAGFNQSLQALTNAGTVNLRSATGAVGNTLTVTGAYVGNNGVLQVATTLGDSSSASDRLLLSGAGAVASGSTQVQVTNVAGLGALTAGDGISVIATENGGRIEPNAFSLAGGHVDAGAFEYRMTHGAQGLYLSSTEIGAGTPVGPATSLYRAEVPLIAALPEQLREANLAMLASRHQRVGEGIGAGAPAGEREAWGRVLSVQRDIDQGGAINPQSHGRLTGFQAGTDLFAGASAEARWQAGLYVGQLDGDMSASGFARGITKLQVGRNVLKNQYLGAYGGYRTSSGLYAEAVLQTARHRYDVEAITSTGAHGKGSSLLASLEVGQSFQLAPGWRLEPQLQLVHQSLNLDDLALGGLTTVGQDTASGWHLRLGLRVQGELATSLGALQPYARVNAYKSPGGTDTASYRTPAALTVLGTPTGGTRTEVALGATLGVSSNTSLYGEIGQLNASGGTTRTKGGVNASVGVKVRW